MYFLHQWNEQMNISVSSVTLHIQSYCMCLGYPQIFPCVLLHSSIPKNRSFEKEIIDLGDRCGRLKRGWEDVKLWTGFICIRIGQVIYSSNMYLIFDP
jgi:hypothetical protein